MGVFDMSFDIFVQVLLNGILLGGIYAPSQVDPRPLEARA